MSPRLTWPFIGNTRLGQMLLDSWQHQTLPTVMVWRGPAEIGKASAAKWLAQVSLCQKLKVGSCGACSACRQCLNGTHPAVVSLAGSADEPITIDHVRLAAGRFRWTSIPGEHRWWIMTDAEYLTEAATNAILKFFEEPPPDLHIILTTAQPDRLLPTILSRAAIYFWHTVSDDDLDPARSAGIGEATWRQLVARSAGRPGRLKMFVAAPELMDAEAQRRDLLLNALHSGQPVRLDKKLDAADMTAMLTTWELVARELLLASMNSTSRRLWPNHPLVDTLATSLQTPDLLRLVERYLNRYQLLQQHVQPRFILEDLQLV